MKKITVGLSVKNIDRLITETEEYKKWLLEKTKVFISRLSDIGSKTAKAEFQSAVYDGDNDVVVNVEMRGSSAFVVAIGKSVLFIEFGTGVTYPDNHPEASQHGMSRGGYGQGKGSRTSWGYYGSPGTNGEVKVNRNGKEVVITKGNPANMPMYNAVKDVKLRVSEIAKEVFR